MSEWARIKLADVAAEVTVGHVGSMAKEYRHNGVPLLRSQNIVPHGFNLEDVKYIGHDFHNRLNKSALHAGDVVTVRTGKPGATAVVPTGWAEANCSDLVITRPGPGLDSYWLSYYINSAAAGYIDSQLVGAVQQHFNVGAAKAMVLHLPPLWEQRAISEVLGALDEKIAANTKIAETADEYIDVRYRVALESAKAEIKPLFEVFEVDFGEAFKGTEFSEPGAGRPLIRIRDLKTYSSQTWTTETRPNEVTVNPGDVLLGMDAEFRPTAWLGEPGVLNQRVCRVRGKETGPAFVRESLKAPMRYIENYKTGTTVIHLNKTDLMQTVITVPGPDELPHFEGETEGLYTSRILASAENRQLAATRDALLPQLMSGKLRVEDAERIVEAAV